MFERVAQKYVLFLPIGFSIELVSSKSVCMPRVATDRYKHTNIYGKLGHMERSGEVVRNRANNSMTSGTSVSQEIDHACTTQGQCGGQEHDARCKEAHTLGSRQETSSQRRCATYKMQQQTNYLQYGAIYD